MSSVPKLAKNVLGGPLRACCSDPMTGFYRTGFCEIGPDDLGVHSVCVIVTDEFLEFSKAMGNDLSTPFPQFNFPGLKAGDKWCLCATRWTEAYDNGVAPNIVLSATHEAMLDYARLEVLVKYAVDNPTTTGGIK